MVTTLFNFPLLKAVEKSPTSFRDYPMDFNSTTTESYIEDKQESMVNSQ